MEFKLSFLCTNAAFEGQRDLEVARILCAIAEQIETDGLPSHFRSVRDHNGNSVGSYGVVEEGDDVT